MKKTLLPLIAAMALGTSAIAQTTISNTDFETGALPAGWTLISSADVAAPLDSGWKFGTATILSSTSFTIPTHTKIAAVNDDKYNADESLVRLITPSLNFSTNAKVFMSFDLFYGQGTYQGATESALLEVSTDNGTTWTTVQTLSGAAAWNSVSIDLSAYAGMSNVMFAFNYNDAGGWLFGCAIDNVKIFEPAQLDAGVTSVDMQQYVVINTAQTVSGTLYNYGGSTISSLDLNYKVDNGAAVTQAFGGLSIAPLSSYNYSHPATWTATPSGNHTIKVWASNINGNADQNTANDTASKIVTVVSQTAPKVALFEQFTSSSCAPCAAEAPAVNALLNANSADIDGSGLAAIRYQMNWPTPSNDPSYNPDGNTRRGYYGVTGIPYFAIDGVESNDDQPSIDAAKAYPAVIDINLSYTVSGNQVNATAVVTPYITTSATTKLHIAVVENHYHYNNVATSQVEFYFIQRKMLPNGNGSTISPLTENVAKTVNQSYTFTVDTYTAVPNPPPAQGSYDLWITGGMSDITVVAFVQDNASKKVYQTAIAQYPLAINEQQVKTKINVYPNPSGGMVYLDINSVSNDNLEVTVTDMLGAIVHKERFSNSGALSTYLDLNNLSSGVYFLNFKNSSGSSVTQKLVLNK